MSQRSIRVSSSSVSAGLVVLSPAGAQPSAARLAGHVLVHTASDTGDDACLAAVRIR